MIKGFKVHSDTDNPQGILHWFAAPDSWDDTPTSQGSWQHDSANGNLTIIPPSKRDFWRKTFYKPILVKDDGPFLYAELDVGKEYTIQTHFLLEAHAQFDQAGLMIRLDNQHWLKTGIEVVDKEPRLSCVVTNVYSDWSTTVWHNFTHHGETVHTSAHIRVHCRGTNFVVQVYQPNTSSWEFVRIAALSTQFCHSSDPLESNEAPWEGPCPPEGKMWAGVFACCPTAQKGGKATFSEFEIFEGSEFDHSADDEE
jgi:regulation of enolase protein 1 (concanavalin A-like superfamily)